MKTMAIRLDDEVANLLSLVAQIEGTSVIDQIRQAIEAHLEQKAQGDLAQRAEALLDEIDREAAARKAAIGTLFEQAAKATPPKSGSGSRRSTKPTEGSAPSEP